MSTRFFRAQPFPLRDVLVAISTWSFPNGTPASEVLILRTLPKPLVRGAYIYRPQTEQELGAEFTAALDTEYHALQWATGKLEEDLLAWAELQPPHSEYPPPVSLREVALADLMQFRQHPDGELVLRRGLRELRSDDMKAQIRRALTIPRFEFQTFKFDEDD